MSRNPCCLCCLRLVHCVPNVVYSVFHAFINLGLLGLGVYLIMHAVNCFHSAVAPLISMELYGGCAAIGGALAIIAIYGLLGPYVCRVAKEDSLKTHYVFALIVLLVSVAYTLIAFLGANDAANLHHMLEYGWERSANDPKRHQDNVAAQLAFDCCGFSGKSDRPATPCPPQVASAASSSGCEAPMTAQLKLQFGMAGILFAGSVGGLLLVMCIGHGFVEKLGQLKRQDASLDGADGFDRTGYKAAQTSKPRRADAAIPRPAIGSGSTRGAAAEVSRGATDRRSGDGAAAYNDESAPLKAAAEDDPTTEDDDSSLKGATIAGGWADDDSYAPERRSSRSKNLSSSKQRKSGGRSKGVTFVPTSSTGV